MNLDLHITEALLRLISTYPREKRLALWVEYYPAGRVSHRDEASTTHYTAVIGDSGSPSNSPNVYGYGITPMAAADEAIRRAGDRDPRRLLEKQLDAARATVAKLEGELAAASDEPPTTAERDEPILYERGELAPADTRTEHDRSL